MADHTDVGVIGKSLEDFRKEMAPVNRCPEIAHVSCEDSVECVQEFRAAEIGCQVRLNPFADVSTNFMGQRCPHLFCVGFDRTDHSYFVCLSRQGQFGVQAMTELQVPGPELLGECNGLCH